MEKNFNDQELSDIMKEIEALEEGFKSEAESPVMQEVQETQEAPQVVMSSEDMTQEEEKQEEEDAPVTEIYDPMAEASEVVKELASMDEEVSIPVAKKEEASVISMPMRSSEVTGTRGSSMSFKVSGSMDLDLQLDVGGKVICLKVTESGLNIEMEGGMTFNLPLNGQVATKKAS